ncbi:peptidoglycan-binding protein LysM [Shewanella mangrovi]|uniref:Peptidoglycan-binding protein LysM n=1 Tax=Shewanella mangrovi TaxID=1515746 RepID=A0A094JA87_9GAMM|nr:LysM domain-containing protein [Shewanella mangrovi]KFZ36172.1 peptidoglycan-binding protein LysM [Shewanella mangrovi]
MDGPMKRFTLLALLAIVCGGTHADVLTLKAGHPESYVVKKGDTLWDISGMFLKDPWRWPKLWGANPQIANPHLIYPGDRLTLVFIDGEPRLVTKPFKKIGPAGQVKTKGDAVPAIDLAVIQPYLVQNRVVDEVWLEQQPKVLGGESPSYHHVDGDVVYVQGNVAEGTKLAFYAPGRKFEDEATGESLGQEIILSATGRVIESGDVSRVLLFRSFQETKAGYRVMSVEDDALMPAYFMPMAGDTEGAKLLAANGNIREMGKLDVAYIDRGAEAGVKPGQVFTVYKPGATVVMDGDGIPVAPEEQSAYDKMKGAFGDEIQLPKLYRGQVMIFKVFDKTSLGLILIDQRPMRVGDELFKPDAILKGE